MRAKRYSSKQLNQIVKDSGILLPNGQVELTKPLKVFKKIYTPGYWSRRFEAIANLIIPIGATVNLCEQGYGSEKKFRASHAYCHSIFSKDGKTEYDNAYSGWATSFFYHSGKKLGLTDEDFENMNIKSELDKPRGSKARKALSKCKAVPNNTFDDCDETCASGIHFFQELNTAKRY